MITHHSTWEELCLQFYPRLSARARRLTHGNAERAKDLVQETVVRILGTRRRPSELGTPLAYMFRTMRNALIDEARKENRMPVDSIDNPLNVESPKQLVLESKVQRDLENKELLVAVSLKGGRLSPRERRLFELLADGKDYEEISGIFKEDIRIIRADCNALKAKLRYRLSQWKR